MPNLQIQLISAEQTYSLRHQVLRPHQELKDCLFPQDHWERTFHVGGFLDGQLAGIATFHEEAQPALKARTPYRLRGMATDFSLHGQGVGRQVLEFGMNQLKQRNCDLLWCNAREVAFPFYEKLGFQYLGDLFDIPGVGPHKIMYRYLSISEGDDAL